MKTINTKYAIKKEIASIFNAARFELDNAEYCHIETLADGTVTHSFPSEEETETLENEAVNKLIKICESEHITLSRKTTEKFVREHYSIDDACKAIIEKFGLVQTATRYKENGQIEDIIVIDPKEVTLPSMEDFFDACKDLRVNGVTLHDGKKNVDFMVKPVVAEIVEHYPDIGDKDDSLEAILYGVFESARDQKHQFCETCCDYRRWWAIWKHIAEKDRKEGNYAPEDDAIAGFAIKDTLETWLAVFMQDIYDEECKKLAKAS